MFFKVPSASYIFGVMALFFMFPSFGQSLRNASWVSQGSATYTIPGQGLAIQQSIGQSSVVGVFRVSGMYVSQGFLRGNRIPATKLERPFEALAFPNSFSDRITFRFTDAHQEITQVHIYDAQGKLLYQAQHQPTNKEIQLSLPHLATGIYVAQLISGTKFVQLRILKKP